MDSVAYRCDATSKERASANSVGSASLSTMCLHMPTQTCTTVELSCKAVMRCCLGYGMGKIRRSQHKRQSGSTPIMARNKGPCFVIVQKREQYRNTIQAATYRFKCSGSVSAENARAVSRCTRASSDKPDFTSTSMPPSRTTSF